MIPIRRDQFVGPTRCQNCAEPFERTYGCWAYNSCLTSWVPTGKADGKHDHFVCQKCARKYNCGQRVDAKSCL